MALEVQVRVRPITEPSVWATAETVIYCPAKDGARFMYNKVFPQSTSNSSVFYSVEPMIHAGFDGKNITVMAYGQTGSGKTHSMTGIPSDEGIIPRTARLLLELQAQHTGSLVSMSCIEIYNENVRDLIGTSKGPLDVHDGPDGPVLDRDTVPLKSFRDFESLAQQIEQSRRYGVTDLNDHSSRSHIILTFEICRPFRSTKTTINLVDLAGSESAARANTDGMQLREGGFINKSLLVLGNVVDAIVDGRSHIPFRESKLTRILRNCLSGHGLTMIVCCINPGKSNFDQTVATLRFTQRAMKITSDPTVTINAPPLFFFQYARSTVAAFEETPELCEAAYQKGLADTYHYTQGTVTSIQQHFEGQTAESLQLMGNIQMMLIAHEHAMGAQAIGALQEQLQEQSQRRQLLDETMEHERKRQREVAAELDGRRSKARRLEALLKEKLVAADAKVADMEYRLQEAEHRQVSLIDCFTADESRNRAQVLCAYAKWVAEVCAQMVGCFKALMPGGCSSTTASSASANFAEKRATLLRLEEHVSALREEVASLELAHEMIRDDLQTLRAEDESPIVGTGEPAATAVVAAVGDSVDALDQRIRELERTERELKSQAVAVVRKESAKRVQESLQRGGGPPQQEAQPELYLRRRPAAEWTPLRLGSPASTPLRPSSAPYVSPYSQHSLTPVRSPTPRARQHAALASSAIPNGPLQQLPKNSSVLALSSDVRSAVNLLKDVKSRYLLPKGQQPQASVPDRGCNETDAPTPSQRPKPTRGDMSNAGADGDEVVGIAARRKLDGAPERPAAQRTMFFLSLSPQLDQGGKLPPRRKRATPTK
jgi:hypothetical protein